MDVCDRCGYAVIQNASGQWVHDSPADAVACLLFHEPIGGAR